MFRLLLLVMLAAVHVSALLKGEKVYSKDLKFTVSFRHSREGHFCGGAAVNKRWIVTAAHCLRGFIDDESVIEKVTVIIGSFLRDPPEHGVEKFTYHLEEVVRYPEFDPYNKDMYHDIALVKVSKEIPKKHTVLIPAKRIDITPGKSAVDISGWGVSDNLRYTLPRWLLALRNLEIVDYKKCTTKSNRKADQNSIICTRSPKGSGPCNKDSGGPVVMRVRKGFLSKTYLVGVISEGFQIECGTGEPDTHTNVQYEDYKDWINKTIN